MNSNIIIPRFQENIAFAQMLKSRKRVTLLLHSGNGTSAITRYKFNFLSNRSKSILTESVKVRGRIWDLFSTKNDLDYMVIEQTDTRKTFTSDAADDTLLFF